MTRKATTPLQVAIVARLRTNYEEMFFSSPSDDAIEVAIEAGCKRTPEEASAHVEDAEVQERISLGERDCLMDAVNALPRIFS